MGWLNAPQDGRDNKSRIEDFGTEHPICKLPNADILVVGHFRRVGPSLSVGMGAYPVTHQEIESYKNTVASSLSEWEAEQVIMMSNQYCAYLNIGKKPCKPPYEREFDEEDIENMNASISKMLDKEEKAIKALKN